MTPAEHPAPDPHPPSAEHPPPDQDPTPDLDLLAAIGQVDPPDPGVLDAARETLWSAVAEEMLGGTVAEARTRGTGRDQAEHRHREHPGP
jgi:hypothetical protein